LEDPVSTPSEALAVQILNKLVVEGILLADDAEKARPKLVGGKMTAEDWRLYIEKAASAGMKA
jgi:hypothetical protein